MEKNHSQSEKSKGHITILGAGMYGMAMAVVANSAAEGNNDVVVWARNNNDAEDINHNHKNSRRFGDMLFDESITATSDLPTALLGAKAVFIVVPAQCVREVMSPLDSFIPQEVPLVICSKGIEQETNMLMTQVVDEVLPGHRSVVLSGPALAKEVVQGLPTALTVAGKDRPTVDQVADWVASEKMVVQKIEDPIGTEVCSALKNVIAIAGGVACGLDMGENARAAVVNMGLLEIQQVVGAMGGKPETVLSFAGVGDLMLTAGSLKSRNTAFGVDIGRGANPSELIKQRQEEGTVVEGYWSTSALASLVKEYDIPTPVTTAVEDILQGIDPEQVINNLFKQ